MMSLWDALRMNMMISYQELVRTFPKLSQSIAECENKNKQEIDSLKKKHEEVFARKIDDHEREVRRLQEYIKLQEVAMDAMKNYKSVEQDIREYNVSGNTRKIHIDD
ncbi:hypothetical protein [Escherichia coli]|uniref:hypothetical protein n=1 Tax=Escherichia coli TaxID=562 RepID=UPI001F38FBA1|nr:hypothetical protein [Escherichia coli]